MQKRVLRNLLVGYLLGNMAGQRQPPEREISCSRPLSTDWGRLNRTIEQREKKHVETKIDLNRETRSTHPINPEPPNFSYPVIYNDINWSCVSLPSVCRSVKQQKANEIAKGKTRQQGQESPPVLFSFISNFIFYHM